MKLTAAETPSSHVKIKPGRCAAFMKIGVQTGGIQTDHSIDETYRIICEAGFDAADANIDELFMPGDIAGKRISPAFAGSEREYLAHAKPWRDASLKYHIDNYQAHAPFPSLVYPDDAYNDYLIEVLKKSIVCSDFIGCRRLIVHPFYYPHEHCLTPEQEREINLDRYSRLIPPAKEYGVTLCLENMFTRHKGRTYSACCGNADEACGYVDELNRIAGANCFGFCLDTGHLLLAGQEIRRTMRALGRRICAFHVHDNNGAEDQHLAPYLGVMDWDRFIEGLADIGYEQTLCFETFRSWENVDASLRKIVLQYVCQAGRTFAERAKARRQANAGIPAAKPDDAKILTDQ